MLWILIFDFFLLVMIFILFGSLVLLVSSDIVSEVSGAPFVPMKRRFVHGLLEFGGLSDKDVFYDLGCGDGRVLLAAAKDFHVRSATGYDISWLPFLMARYRIRNSGLKNIRIRRQNFMAGNYGDATFIYVYLFPKAVDRLAGKFARELPTGARVLAPSFPIDLAKHPEFSLLKTEKIGKITAYLYQKR